MIAKLMKCRCLLLVVALWHASVAEEVPRMLPGELSAEDVLNGVYPFPPSPRFDVNYDTTGFAFERVSKVPPPGVHPRILISPEDLPDLRRRVLETEARRGMLANVRLRTDRALRDPREWSCLLYQRLVAGDAAGALALVDERKGFPQGGNLYQPWI